MIINQNGGMTYAKFFPSDWRTGCLSLNLEEEGLYVRICMFMYDTGRAVPDNDTEAAHMLSVQIHKYKKVIASLIAKGKIIRAQGMLINERVMEEFDRWRMQQAARSEAARKREAERKVQLQRELEEALAKKAAANATPQLTPGVTPPVTPPVSQGVTTPVPHGVTQGFGDENPNEINGHYTTAVPEPWHEPTTNPESRIQKPEKKENKQSTTEQDAARSGGGIQALNGSAETLIRFIAEHADVSPKIARDMLANNARAYGAEALLQAHSLTEARMASTMVAKPYLYMLEAARRIKDGKIKVQKASGPSRFGRGA